MRTLLLGLVLALAATAPTAQPLPAEARAYLGDWVTRDDDTGEPQAIVRIRASDGRLEGRIVRVLPTREDPTPSVVCTDCRGTYSGADLRTVRLLWDLRWDGDGFSGGYILDPRSGRTYRALMELDGPDRLRVRGFVGVRLLGRTQVWERVG